jgi:hypothetical protein
MANAATAARLLPACRIKSSCTFTGTAYRETYACQNVMADLLAGGVGFERVGTDRRGRKGKDMSAEGQAHSVDTRKPFPLERLAALSGALSVVLAFAGISFADYGGKGIAPDQPVAAIGAGFTEHAGSARVGAVLLLASVTLSLIFLGPLWSRLQRGAVWLAAIAVSGGVVGSAFLLETAMFTVAGAVAGDVGDGQTARTLLILGWESARAVVAPALATVAAATVAGFRYGVFPPWFSWLSLGFTVLLLIALLPFGPAGLLATSSSLWTVIASLWLTFEPAWQAQPGSR